MPFWKLCRCKPPKQLDRIEDQNWKILANQNTIIANQEKIMAQIDDLNALVTSLQTDVSNVQADVATVIAQLQAIPGVDMTDALAKLGAIHTALGTVDASLKAVEPPPTETPAA
jgi:hypothetical protein